MQKLLIAHVWNEEFLIPFWVRHHRTMFDKAVIIDYGSTDRTKEIIHRTAPDGWKIVHSRTPGDKFYAVDTDAHVMDVERTFPGWKVCLNATEFLLAADFDAVLREHEAKAEDGCTGFWTQDLCMADTAEEIDRPVSNTAPLWLQRWHGAPSPDGIRSRLVHNFPCGDYQPGRHQTNIASLDKNNPKTHDRRVFMLWFGNSPAAEIRKRRLQIQTKIPEEDRRQRLGFHHFLTPEELDAQIRAASASARNLFDFPGYAEAFTATIHKLLNWEWVG
jgi:hypothetical protein